MRRALLLVPLFLAATASAQPTNSKTLADQLFQQGRDLAKAKNWVEACPKFEGSLQYDPAIGTKLNLATCYEKTNRPASAWGLYREVIEEATRTKDKRLALAKKAAAAIEPKLPKLAIIAPTPVPPGLVVERDGIAIATAELGNAIYVDPGPHHVKASAPGFLPYEHDVTAIAAQPITDTLPPLEAAPIVVTPPPLVEPRPGGVVVGAPPLPPPAPSHRRAIGLGVGIAGVAVAGVGLVFGARANSKLSEAHDLCGDDLACAHDDVATGQGLIDDSRSAATLSTVFVIAGGAAIVGGLVLVLTAPRHATEHLALVPVIDGQQAGLAAVGHF